MTPRRRSEPCAQRRSGLGFRVYMGIMEKKMEITIMGYIGIIGHILGLYRDNGKENGNYYNGYFMLTSGLQARPKQVLR